MSSLGSLRTRGTLVSSRPCPPRPCLAAQVNGTNVLELGEFTAAMVERLGVEADDARILFHKIDKDGSGSVDFYEMVRPGQARTLSARYWKTA